MKILGGMTRERDRQREESEDSSRQANNGYNISAPWFAM
jgi:hypothetical protein